MAKTYKINKDSNSTFTTPSTGTPVNLTSLTDISITETSTPVDHSTDGSPYVEAVYVDNIAVDVTITSTDLDAFNGFVAGDAGTLVIVGVERLNGSGTDGSLTATMDEAVLINKGNTIASGGLANVSATFRVPASDDSYPIVWS